MAKRTLSQALALFITAAAFTFTSCRENTIINTNLTPTGDSLNTETETIEIIAQNKFSHFNTSLYFSGFSVIQGLGTISNDPEIGSINANMFFQVVPPKSNGYVLPQIDSVVLVLPYARFSYGDTNSTTPQTFKVYRITDTMTRGTAYYDNSHKPYDMTPLASKTVTVSSLKDSVTVNEGKVRPHLRIKIDGVAGNLSGANYNSYAEFLSTFNGIHVQADSTAGGNALAYFQLSDNGAGGNYAKAAILVYHHSIDSPNVAIADVFGYDPTNCAHFNQFNMDITGAAASYLSYSETKTQSDQFLFLQSRPGLSIDIVTKGLASMPNRLINRAYIVLTEVQNPVSPEIYFQPQALFPYKPGVNDTLMPIADQIFTTNGGTSVSGIEFIDGERRTVSINGVTYNQYILNVPRELQHALKNKQEMHLRITGAASGYYGAFRLRAYGNDPANAPFNISLKVVYSKLQ